MGDCHRALLLTDAVLAELLFGETGIHVPLPAGCGWLASRGTQAHRALLTVARVDEAAVHCFLVTLLQARTQMSVGVKACLHWGKERDHYHGLWKVGCCRRWLSSMVSVVCGKRKKMKSISDLRAVALCSLGTSAWRLKRIFNSCGCWGRS